uniref:Uncharacterized protein n=1 Tax=Arundo donax TaxID=35708 RepID=A0A0A9D3G5_ARUDO
MDKDDELYLAMLLLWQPLLPLIDQSRLFLAAFHLWQS